jgi:hypothetical protein
MGAEVDRVSVIEHDDDHEQTWAEWVEALIGATPEAKTIATTLERLERDWVKARKQRRGAVDRAEKAEAQLAIARRQRDECHREREAAEARGDRVSVIAHSGPWTATICIECGRIFGTGHAPGCHSAPTMAGKVEVVPAERLRGAVDALKIIASDRGSIMGNSDTPAGALRRTAREALARLGGAAVSVTAHCETCGQPVREWNGSRNDLIGLSSMWAKRAHAAEGEVEALRQQLAGGGSSGS